VTLSYYLLASQCTVHFVALNTAILPPLCKHMWPNE